MRLQKRFKPILKKNIANKDYGCISPKFVNYYEEKLLKKYNAGNHLKQIVSPAQRVSDDDFNDSEDEAVSNDFDQ